MDKDFKKKFKAAYKNGTITPELELEATEMVSDLLFPIYRYMERVIKEYIESEKNKNTYFMIMSDHGELFGEDGYFGHGPIFHEKVFEVFYLEGRRP